MNYMVEEDFKYACGIIFIMYLMYSRPGTFTVQQFEHIRVNYKF